MQRVALALVAMLCGTSVAAPVPFVERKAPEAVLETGNKQRADAVVRWAKSPDLAQMVEPDAGKLPESFLKKLKFKTTRNQVVLRLEGSSRPEERALFEKLVKALTKPVNQPPQSGPMDEVEAVQQIKIQQINGRVRFGGRRGGREMDPAMQKLQEQMADREIRSNPPRLIAGPTLR